MSTTDPQPAAPRFGASDLAMLGVVLAWGSNYTLVKEALAVLPAVARLDLAQVPPLAWVALAYSALVPLVVCYVVWNQSVRTVGPGRTALYNAGIPVAAALTAWAARGERPTLAQGAGAGLILAGVLVTRRR